MVRIILNHVKQCLTLGIMNRWFYLLSKEVIEGKVGESLLIYKLLQFDLIETPAEYMFLYVLFSTMELKHGVRM